MRQWIHERGAYIRVDSSQRIPSPAKPTKHSFRFEECGKLFRTSCVCHGEICAYLADNLD